MDIKKKERQMTQKIFYSEKQSTTSNSSFSPSAGKPQELVKAVRNLKIPVEITRPHLVAEREDFYTVHDRDFVDSILDGLSSNGFGNKIKEVNQTLKYTTGALLSAADYAYFNKAITCAPVSGFHHAGHAYCGGFCTFNGLLVTAHYLQKKYKAKVAIIDLDQHYGDGSVDIIKKLNLSSFITHYTFGQFGITSQSAEKWLKGLYDELYQVCKNANIILYQAGADPHINDPLGGVLTTEQMKQRDEIVFSIAKKLDLPLSWVLAGGYQTPLQKVLSIHLNTLTQSLKTFGRDKDSHTN